MVGWFNALRLGQTLADQAKRLRHDAGGFAAVEFAMIVPVLLIMLIGAVETSDALTVSGRMINISGSVADMAARCTAITSGDLNDIMAISNSLIDRYPSQNLYIEVVDVQADASNNLTVAWSYDRDHKQPLAAGTTYTGLSAGLVPPNGQLIVATATYTYHSPMGHFIHGAVKLSHTSYNSPRLGPVTFSTGSGVATGGC